MRFGAGSCCLTQRMTAPAGSGALVPGPAAQSVPDFSFEQNLVGLATRSSADVTGVSPDVLLASVRHGPAPLLRIDGALEEAPATIASCWRVARRKSRVTAQ